MINYRERYIELHSLEFDIQHSVCGECEYLHDCRHYTKEGCPYNKEE